MATVHEIRMAFEEAIDVSLTDLSSLPIIHNIINVYHTGFT